jgi:hypothetical protein
MLMFFFFAGQFYRYLSAVIRYANTVPTAANISKIFRIKDLCPSEPKPVWFRTPIPTKQRENGTTNKTGE